MTGKCPKCQKPINRVTISDVTVDGGGKSKWKGVGHTCPYCFTMISIEIDPIALRGDIIEGVVKRLREG